MVLLCMLGLALGGGVMVIQSWGARDAPFRMETPPLQSRSSTVIQENNPGF